MVGRQVWCTKKCRKSSAAHHIGPLLSSIVTMLCSRQSTSSQCCLWSYLRVMRRAEFEFDFPKWSRLIARLGKGKWRVMRSRDHRQDFTLTEFLWQAHQSLCPISHILKNVQATVAVVQYRAVHGGEQKNIIRYDNYSGLGDTRVNICTVFILFILFS